MNLEQYIEKVSVFNLAKGNLFFLECGYMGEVGEVFSLYAKRERGDNIPNFEEKLNLEIGDCFWYAGQLWKEFGKKTSLASAYGWADEITGCCPSVLVPAFFSDVRYSLWRVIAFCDNNRLKIEEILEINVKKLEDRAARGKIQGNGDNR